MSFHWKILVAGVAVVGCLQEADALSVKKKAGAMKGVRRLFSRGKGATNSVEPAASPSRKRAADKRPSDLYDKHGTFFPEEPELYDEADTEMGTMHPPNRASNKKRVRPTPYVSYSETFEHGFMKSSNKIGWTDRIFYMAPVPSSHILSFGPTSYHSPTMTESIKNVKTDHKPVVRRCQANRGQIIYIMGFLQIIYIIEKLL